MVNHCHNNPAIAPYAMSTTYQHFGGRFVQKNPKQNPESGYTADGKELKDLTFPLDLKEKGALAAHSQGTVAEDPRYRLTLRMGDKVKALGFSAEYLAITGTRKLHKLLITNDMSSCIAGAIGATNPVSGEREAVLFHSAENDPHYISELMNALYRNNMVNLSVALDGGALSTSHGTRLKELIVTDGRFNTSVEFDYMFQRETRGNKPLGIMIAEDGFRFVREVTTDSQINI